MTTNQPASQVNMSCPVCGERVIALVLDEAQPGGLVRRWWGRCGICDWRLMMSATGPADGGPGEEGEGCR
jgi:hypothetical protein